VALTVAGTLPSPAMLILDKDMPLHQVGALDSLPPGSVTEVAIGDDTYAVCNVDGKLHCIAGTCPHAGGPLGQGALSGNFLVCPWHGWEFDCTTGKNDFDEDVQVETFRVIVEGKEIVIDIP